MPTIPSTPYAWPFDGDVTPQNTTLIIIDMQTDFCGKGGYVDKMGYDLSLTRAPIEPISRVLAALRAENQAHFYRRPDHSSTRLARRSLMETFVPSSPRWRARTVAQGLEIIRRSVKDAKRVQYRHLACGDLFYAPSTPPVECSTCEFFRNLLDGECEGGGPSSAEVLGYASQ